MTEHAHDPMPHEEQEPDVPVAPNATVTGAQVVAALESGRWSHDDPNTALWLNTSFAPAGREMVAVILDLNAHGVYVID